MHIMGEPHLWIIHSTSQVRVRIIYYINKYNLLIVLLCNFPKTSFGLTLVRSLAQCSLFSCASLYACGDAWCGLGEILCTTFCRVSHRFFAVHSTSIVVVWRAITEAFTLAPFSGVTTIKKRTTRCIYALEPIVMHKWALMRDCMMVLPAGCRLATTTVMRL